MIDGTGRVAAWDGPAKPDDVQPSEGGDVTALPATIECPYCGASYNDLEQLEIHLELSVCELMNHLMGRREA